MIALNTGLYREISVMLFEIDYDPRKHSNNILVEYHVPASTDIPRLIRGYWIMPTLTPDRLELKAREK